MVEIAKAFCTRLSVLILDEPTASLTDREAERLFVMIEQAKRARRRHHLCHPPHERDPPHRRPHHRAARRQAGSDARRRRGRRRAAAAAHDRTRDQPGLSQDRVSAGRAAAGNIGPHHRRAHGRRISLSVRAGEVVGLAGLVGCGKSEVGRACFGLERILSGRITFDGRDVTGAQRAACSTAARSICRPTGARKGW